MRMRKWPFLFLVYFIAISPFLAYKAWWVATAIPAEGRAMFQGKELMGQMERTYTVVSYATKTDSSWFNTSSDFLLPKNTRVKVLYHEDDLQGARLTDAGSLFADLLIPAGIVLTMVLLVGLHKHIIPRGARFAFSRRRPFVSMIEYQPF